MWDQRIGKVIIKCWTGESSLMYKLMMMISQLFLNLKIKKRLKGEKKYTWFNYEIKRKFI